MALTITKQPHNIIAARMPVVFTVVTDHQGYCRLKGGITGKADSIEPDNNHAATFEFSDYVADTPVLNAQLTAPATHAAEDAAPTVTFLFAERYGTPPADENVIELTHQVINARIPHWKHDLATSIGAWINAVNPFLTFYPNQPRKVLPTELIHLYYMNVDQYQEDYMLSFDITFTDGTTAGFKGTAIQQPAEFDILQYDASPEVVEDWAAINEPNKTVQQYTAKVVCTLNGYTDRSETRTFVINRMPFSNRRQIWFRNSLGTFDQLMLRGSAEITTQTTRLTATRQAGYDQAQVPDRVTWYNEGRQRLLCETGYLLTAERTWLNELLMSKEIYEVQNTVLVPLELKTETLTQYHDDQALLSLELKFEYLQTPVIQ